MNKRISLLLGSSAADELVTCQSNSKFQIQNSRRRWQKMWPWADAEPQINDRTRNLVQQRMFLAGLLVMAMGLASTLAAQSGSKSQAERKGEAKQDEAKREAPRSKSGKKLLTAMDALRVSSVGGVAVSPDGKRVAYTASEHKMEKDKEWTSNTHVWVTSTTGGATNARQYTRGDKSESNPAWSADGKYLAFLSNREKESERQVWFLWADGGEGGR